MPEIENYAELNSAITKEMGAPLVTKWLILGELVDEDGDRRLFHVSSDSCLYGDQLGLLSGHEQLLQARRTADVISGAE